MNRTATTHDIDAILDRLACLPPLDAPLRDDVTVRERLRNTGAILVEKLATPRSEVESHLRWELRRLAGMD